MKFDGSCPDVFHEGGCANLPANVLPPHEILDMDQSHLMIAVYFYDLDIIGLRLGSSFANSKSFGDTQGVPVWKAVTNDSATKIAGFYITSCGTNSSPSSLGFLAYGIDMCKIDSLDNEILALETRDTTYVHTKELYPHPYFRSYD